MLVHGGDDYYEQSGIIVDFISSPIYSIQENNLSGGGGGGGGNLLPVV